MADFNELTETKDCTSEFDPADVQENKVKSIFAYISWLVLVPIFGAKESKFARFHANQGLVLAIVEIAVYLVRVIFHRVPVLGWLTLIVEALVMIPCTILSVFGIVNVARGQAKSLPVIGKIKILK